MTDFIQHFKNNLNRISPVLIELGYSLSSENLNENPGENSYEYKFTNNSLFVNLYLRITRFEDQTYLISFSMYNKKENEITFTWKSFHLFDYIDDNSLQDKFIYKIQGDEKAEAFIDQYFKNLEFALNDYLMPYLTGEKYIDHYVKTMNEYYSHPAVQQMQEDVIKEHLAKKGNLTVFRQKVIVFKQDIRQFVDKFKSLFLIRK